jgi:O-antigen/teichoic acid export membrane protein
VSADVPPRAVVEPGEEGWPGTGPDPAASTTAASLLRGGAWNTTSRLVPQLYVLAISIAGARFLGAEQFGRQSFIAFVQLSLMLFLSGGIAITATRYIGDALGRREPDAVARLVRWVWRVEALAAIVGGTVLLVAAALGAEPESAWVLAGVACTLGVLHAAPSALLIGGQRWRAASIVGLVTGAGSTVAIIVVLALGGGITGMFAVEAAVALVNVVWTSVLARRALAEVAPARARRRLDRAVWRSLRRELWRYAIPTTYGFVLTIVVWRRSEFFFLDHYSTDVQIGLYSVVFAVVAALVQLPDAIAAITLPAVATLSGAGQMDRVRGGFSRALRLVLFATLPVTAVALALGPTLLRVVYGEEFRDTGPVLLIMLAPFPLLPLLSLSRAVLTALGRLRVPLLIETGAAALNLALAFMLVRDEGAVGAAIANVAAQASAAVLVLAYSLVAVGAPEWRPFSLWRAAVAALAAGLAGWACVASLPDVPGLVLGSLAAAVTFAVLAVVLRILPPEDAVWIDEHIGDRLWGLVGAFCRRCA